MTNKIWATSVKQQKPKVPESIKQSLKEKAEQLIEGTLKPRYIQPPPTEHDFNYIADIYCKWYRNYFYFCATYNSPSPNAISPSFESKFARMEYVGDEKYNLSFMRHNGQWVELYYDLPINKSLELIVEDGCFSL